MEDNSLYTLLFEQGNEIRELKNIIEALKSEVDEHRRALEKAIDGECLLVIPNTFIACGECGYYCSASCKLAASLKLSTLREAHYYQAYEALKEQIR